MNPSGFYNDEDNNEGINNDIDDDMDVEFETLMDIDRDYSDDDDDLKGSNSSNENNNNMHNTIISSSIIDINTKITTQRSSAMLEGENENTNMSTKMSTKSNSMDIDEQKNDEQASSGDNKTSINQTPSQIEVIDLVSSSDESEVRKGEGRSVE